MTNVDSRIKLTLGGERVKEDTSADIHPVAVYEQAPLYTGQPLPIVELMARQAIDGPQGLAPFADPEWELDGESERFLEAIFAESD